MSEEIARESPLARFRPAQPVTAPLEATGIVAWERPFLGHLNLRGDRTDGRFPAAAAAVLGTTLPQVPNTVAVGPRNVIYWLGPDEWLLVTAGEEERTVAAGLREGLTGIFSSVTAIGSGQTIIVLQGSEVRNLLCKGCPLDLHARGFAPGACAQTRLAKAAVLLRPLAKDTMELIVRRSFADYLWSWLSDAADEYGFSVATEAASVTAAQPERAAS